MEKNNIIRPRPWTFSKSSLWLRRETTSADTNQSGDMPVISSPKRPLPLDDDMLWWENRLAEKEGTSCSITGLGKELFTDLWDEDMEPATKGGDTFVEDGNNGWGELCFGVDLWD
ncbi:hypothetical protein HHK36_029965 [Tetracentron sinense]|uniref:Uncharacterized protein n=1 Tax=Tetracentron sinense TaxID=13715 RepID=A0A834YEP2_TETSI|nr:hypothetical protein HHK36_029965 [Tetracentron sinense]